MPAHQDDRRFARRMTPGFSSTSEGNALTEEQQWDKLRLIVETAQSVWG